MKELILVRHAKSDWGDTKIDDFDRPLNDRGLKDAPMMAQRIVELPFTPDHILSSPALRAITTARLMDNEFSEYNKGIEEISSLYLSGVSNLLSIVQSINKQHSKVILFSHNPGITEFANYLNGSRIENMPTCSAIYCNFQINNWSEVDEKNGTQLGFYTPKGN